MILFSNEEKEADKVSCDDVNIDFDAAKYWLKRAIHSKSKVAEKNLRVLDVQFLKGRLQGDYWFKRDDFLEK